MSWFLFSMMKSGFVSLVSFDLGCIYITLHCIKESVIHMYHNGLKDSQVLIKYLIWINTCFFLTAWSIFPWLKYMSPFKPLQYVQWRVIHALPQTVMRIFCIYTVWNCKVLGQLHALLMKFKPNKFLHLVPVVIFG